MIDDAINGRLENWQRWRLGDAGNPLSYPSSSLLDVHVTHQAHGARVPVQSMDAVELDRAIAVLPLRNGRALAWIYLRPDLTQSEAARACGCSVRVLLRDVEHAKGLIKQRLAQTARLRRNVRQQNQIDTAPN